MMSYFIVQTTSRLMKECTLVLVWYNSPPLLVINLAEQLQQWLQEFPKYSSNSICS